MVLSYIKKWLHQGQFLETFGGEVIPTKMSVMVSYFGSSLQYVSIDVVLQLIMKNIMFKALSYGLQFLGMLLVGIWKYVFWWRRSILW